MNNYFSQLGVTDPSNLPISEQIQMRQLAMAKQKKSAEEETGITNIVGGEFIKVGLEQMGKGVAAKTGFSSLGNLGKNISSKGFTKGLSQTIADARKEALAKGTSFGQADIDSLTSRAKGMLSKTAQGKLSDIEKWTAGRKNAINNLNRDLQNKGLPTLDPDDVTTPSSELLQKFQDIKDKGLSTVQEGALTEVPKVQLGDAPEPTVQPEDPNIPAGSSAENPYTALPPGQEQSAAPAVSTPDPEDVPKTPEEEAYLQDILSRNPEYQAEFGEAKTKLSGFSNEGQGEGGERLTTTAPEPTGQVQFGGEAEAPGSGAPAPIASAEASEPTAAATTSTTQQDSGSSGSPVPTSVDEDEDEGSAAKSTANIEKDVDTGIQDTQVGADAVEAAGGSILGGALPVVLGLASLILPSLFESDSSSAPIVAPPTVSQTSTLGQGR